jgi:hypothetical protein
MKKPQKPAGPIEGEGSYTGTRKYNAELEQWVKSGRVEESAKAASQAIDGPEGQELRRAEQIGRSGPKSKSVSKPSASK